MHSQTFFLQMLVFLAAAVVAVPVAKRLGLGSVLGYLIAGIAIGPYGIGYVGDDGQSLMHFAEFGVVMMLFLIGLELDPARLWRLRVPILGLGGAQVLVSSVVGAALATIFGMEWRGALAIGIILALSSTAMVLQSLQEKNLLATDGGQSAFSVLLFQDIAVIPIMAMLPLLARPDVIAEGGGPGHHAGPLEGLSPWLTTFIILCAIALVIAIGRFLVGPVFRFIARTHLREIFTAAALLLVIGIAMLMSVVGLSPALGTFVAGVVLANSEYRHELEGDIEPFKGLLLGLFFIAVGASIDFGQVMASPGTVVGLVALLMVAKAVVMFAIGKLFKMAFDQNLLLAVVLAQGGEFAFVLLSQARAEGVLSAAEVGPLIAVVALSMALTPFALLFVQRVLMPRFGTLTKGTRKADAIDEQNPVIIAGFGRFGNIVGRFLRANGVGCTVLDLDSDNVEVLRKLGIKVFYGDATRTDLLHAAGAGDARLLVVALDSPEKCRELVDTARRHFPHLRILARAQDRPDAYGLLADGVEEVYRETFDTSLRMGVSALRLLGYRAFEARRSALLFERHDEAALRELAGMRGDRSAYMSRARERIAHLERVLQEELREGRTEKDEGWETQSLQEEMRSRAET
jgi:CPA2 family monovalent cation:H+ antiporter-2